MRIHSLAHVLAAPFVVVTGIMLYLAFQNYNMTASYALLPLVIIIVLIYIFAPQINFWWNQRNPPVLDNEIVDWFEQFSPFYKELDTAGKKRYLDRISIFMEGKEFFSMGSEKNEMPDDFKAIIAEQAIKLTFHREDYMFNKYERIACYKHPFPSPQYQFLHTVETEHEDGVILYSLEHALPGITRKDEYYNIVLHGFIEAFIKRNKNLRYPNIGQEHFPALQQISGFTEDRVAKITGFGNLDGLIVAINYFFVFPDKFERLLPEAYQKLQSIFFTRLA